VILCLALITWIIVKKVDKQTDALINIVKAFSDISIDLEVIKTRIEDYSEEVDRNSDNQLNIITASLKTLSDRIDKLEKANMICLSKLDNDVNRLWGHCARKMERDLR
jgi:DNA-binding transcriptional MerR regulator